MPLFDLQKISKEYVNDEVVTPVLRGVTFSIDEGEFVSIMGPSGSGKSTLMHIMGFLDRPSGGTYRFVGKETDQFSDDQLASIRNRQVGFVFQAFHLMARTSVLENVKLPLLYSAFKGSHDERAKQALSAVGLSHRLQFFTNQLSGGEKQRVAIARALVNDPKVIFADEPTGNLDSKSGLTVMSILQKLNDEGRTIILVTHETYTSQHAKRIIRLKDGQIVGDEKVHERILADHYEELMK